MLTLPGALVVLVAGINTAHELSAQVVKHLGGRIGDIGGSLVWLCVGLLLCLPAWRLRSRKLGHRIATMLPALLGLTFIWPMTGAVIRQATESEAQLAAERIAAASSPTPTPSEPTQASPAASQPDAADQQAAMDARREATTARQRVQHHWGEVLSRLGTARGTAGGTQYLDNPNPVAVINMLRVSSDMAEEARQAAKDAFVGEGYLGEEWQPVFDDLRISSTSLIEANKHLEAAVDAESASELADAQQWYHESERRVIKAIHDGRDLYATMGGDPKSLPTYGFKP